MPIHTRSAANRHRAISELPQGWWQRREEAHKSRQTREPLLVVKEHPVFKSNIEDRTGPGGARTSGYHDSSQRTSGDWTPEDSIRRTESAASGVRTASAIITCKTQIAAYHSWPPRKQRANDHSAVSPTKADRRSAAPSAWLAKSVERGSPRFVDVGVSVHPCKPLADTPASSAMVAGLSAGNARTSSHLAITKLTLTRRAWVR